MYRVRESVVGITYKYEVVTESGALVQEIGTKQSTNVATNPRIVGPTIWSEEEAVKFAKAVMR